MFEANLSFMQQVLFNSAPFQSIFFNLSVSPNPGLAAPAENAAKTSRRELDAAVYEFMASLEPSQSPDLETCAKEPIHIPSSIQPHGALAVFDSRGECIQKSVNFPEFLGLGQRDISLSNLQFLDEQPAVALDDERLFEAPMTLSCCGRLFDATFHRVEGGGFAVEFEHDHAVPTVLLNRKLLEALEDFRSCVGWEPLFQRIVEFISKLISFERVMLYRFDEKWNGQVVAESLEGEADSYLGLHFPASDIPAQARELYTHNWLRTIPNATYAPVPIEPAINPVTRKPLDMSGLMLRSVSPIHLEYLRNMGVVASMSISVVVDGRLWGLIACHHSAPKVMPLAVRSLCEIFGRVVSTEIGSRMETERLNDFVAAAQVQTRFFDVISAESKVADALKKYTSELLNLVDAGGAAVCLNGQIDLHGETPNATEVQALVEWLSAKEFTTVYSTDCLMRELPTAEKYSAVGSGILVARFSRVEEQFIIFFRPEVFRDVTWAGNPQKPVDDSQRINPRKSFAAWKQTIVGHSIAWSEAALATARELTLAIDALVLRRNEKLLSENAVLERTNSDLNSFAHIAAHDLREPLRSISNYVRFIREDHADALPSEGLRKLDTLDELVDHSRDLIKSLGRFSEVGRIEVECRQVNLNSVFDQAFLAFATDYREKGIEIIKRDGLPTVAGDPTLIREVFSNLLSNAAKYITEAPKIVEVGTRQSSYGLAVYVRDNGIGISPEFFEDVFTMFRRLHPLDEFGGGTGAGLAIVKAIVEKHGGRVWVESMSGEGSTFLFTLGRADIKAGTT